MNYYVIPGIKGNKDIYFEQIIREVLNLTGVEIDQLKKRCRKRELVFTRQLIVYYLRSYTKMDLIDIAEYFNQDHTTIMHSYQTICNLIFSNNREVKNSIQIIDNSLSSKYFKLTRVRPLKD